LDQCLDLGDVPCAKRLSEELRALSRVKAAHSVSGFVDVGTRDANGSIASAEQ
jgi:hypothetical protein